MFTQPIMYSIIKKHKNVLDKYSDQLVAEGVCTKEEVAEVIGNYEQVFFFALSNFSRLFPCSYIFIIRTFTSFEMNSGN